MNTIHTIYYIVKLLYCKYVCTVHFYDRFRQYLSTLFIRIICFWWDFGSQDRETRIKTFWFCLFKYIFIYLFDEKQSDSNHLSWWVHSEPQTKMLKLHLREKIPPTQNDGSLIHKMKWNCDPAVKRLTQAGCLNQLPSTV